MLVKSDATASPHKLYPTCDLGLRGWQAEVSNRKCVKSGMTIGCLQDRDLEVAGYLEWDTVQIVTRSVANPGAIRALRLTPAKSERPSA